MVLHYKALGALYVSHLPPAAELRSPVSLRGEMCADVKGLVKALGHSGLCWVVTVQHARIEINYLSVEEHCCDIYSRMG